MEKIGIVKELDGDYVKIQVVRASACGENCASCKGGCTPTAVFIRAKNGVGASVGQYVMLKSEPRKVLKAAFLIYIVPLLGLILGVIGGIGIANYLGYSRISELVGIVTGFILMGLSFLFLRYKDKKIKEDNSMDIIISHIIS